MTTSRLLGRTERLFYKMREYGGINPLVFVHGTDESEGADAFRIDQARLLRALEKVVSESFLLRAIVDGDSGVPAFKLCEDMELPVAFVDNCTEQGFIDIVEDQLCIDYGKSATLWHFTVVSYRDDPKKLSIIACFDHTIADGTGMCYFIDEVLQQYEHLSDHDDTSAVSVEPPLEQFTDYKLNFKDFLYFAPNEISKMLRPPMQPVFENTADFSERKTKLIYSRFSESFTQRILQAAREHDTTLHGLLVAAFLISVARKKWKDNFEREKQTTKPVLKLSTTNNVSFRGQYNIPQQQMGVYISGVNNQFSVSEDIDIWSLARLVISKINLSKQRQLHISSTLIFELLQRIMTDAMRIKIANGKDQGRLETLCVSNMGRLDIAGKYGDIKLTDFGVCGGQHGFGPSYMILPLSFNNRLSFIFHYIDPLISREHAREVCDGIEKSMIEAIDNP